MMNGKQLAVWFVLDLMLTGTVMIASMAQDLIWPMFVLVIAQHVTGRVEYSRGFIDGKYHEAKRELREVHKQLMEYADVG